MDSIPPPPYVAAVSARAVSTEPRRADGGGLLVTPRHVATCLHVIALADPNAGSDPSQRRSLEDKIPSVRAPCDLGDVEILVAVGFGNRLARWTRARLLAECGTRDLAILELDDPVHGVAPPVFAADPRPPATFVCFGQGDGVIASVVHAAGDTGAAIRFDAGKAAPDVQVFDHGAPAGFSGGPVVADGDAGHRLIGLAVVGGFGSPVGGLVTAAALGDFLRESGLSGPTPPPGAHPGVAARFEIEIPGGVRVAFRPVADGGPVIFRAERPLSAADLRRLRPGESAGPAPLPALAGRAAELPAHLATREDAGRALAALGRPCFGRFRLPTLAELHRFLAEEGAPRPVDLGRPLSLADWGEGAAGMATPPGGTEWTADTEEGPMPVRRAAASGRFERLDPEAAVEGHARFTLQPVFVPGQPGGPRP